MGGNRLRMFERSAILQICRNPCRAKSMAADRILDAGYRDLGVQRLGQCMVTGYEMWQILGLGKGPRLSSTVSARIVKVRFGGRVIDKD